MRGGHLLVTFKTNRNGLHTITHDYIESIFDPENVNNMDSKSTGVHPREGSTPSLGTISTKSFYFVSPKVCKPISCLS